MSDITRGSPRPYRQSQGPAQDPGSKGCATAFLDPGTAGAAPNSRFRIGSCPRTHGRVRRPCMPRGHPITPRTCDPEPCFAAPVNSGRWRRVPPRAAPAPSRPWPPHPPGSTGVTGTLATTSRTRSSSESHPRPGCGLRTLGICARHAPRRCSTWCAASYARRPREHRRGERRPLACSGSPASIGATAWSVAPGWAPQCSAQPFICSWNSQYWTSRVGPEPTREHRRAGRPPHGGLEACQAAGTPGSGVQRDASALLGPMNQRRRSASRRSCTPSPRGSRRLATSCEGTRRARGCP
jgi:hypothetical protein